MDKFVRPLFVCRNSFPSQMKEHYLNYYNLDRNFVYQASVTVFRYLDSQLVNVLFILVSNNPSRAVMEHLDQFDSQQLESFRNYIWTILKLFSGKEIDILEIKDEMTEDDFLTEAAKFISGKL